MRHFQDRVVWITGSSSGIGAALAIEMAGAGARLALSGRNQQALEKIRERCAQQGAAAEIFPFDIGQSDQISEVARRVLDHYNRLDLLVNNAGISQRSMVQDTGMSVDRQIMEVNYFGNIALTKFVLPFMVQQGHGHIAVTTSIVGHFGFPLRSAYSASKHALYGFYESLRTELSGSGIRVSFITPGRIQTDISLHALNNQGEEQGVMDPGQAHGMAADRSAQIIMKGLIKQKREILVGGREVWMVYIHKFFPTWFYRIVRKISRV